MAKCKRCGKGGFFFKLNSEKLCSNCVIELESEHRLQKIQSSLADAESKLQNINAEIENKDQILSDLLASAKNDARVAFEKEQSLLNDSLNPLRSAIADAGAELQKLTDNCRSAQERVDSAKRQAEKLKSFVISVKAARQKWLEGESAEEAIALMGGYDIEELLPQPDLNCLTIKQLKSRYNNLRKQIVDLCKSYESRYTTKANAALYKLMVLALEAELENILHKLQYGKLENGLADVRDLTAKYYAIGAEGNQSIAPTLQRFIGQIESLYNEVVETEYEYYVQRERAKEEQRALKEQMRQEAEERKRLEQERKQVEAEEKKYLTEIDRITTEMQRAHDSEIETLRKRLEEVNALMSKVSDKKAEIINLQNGKAGTVYIISNIGSFGDHVFKVGMTRRLEPQDRVNELGDASVPFPFDVHSFIFSEDAVALESALHKELNDRRVNKVNLRKEFFNISIEELQAMVERIDPTAPFRVTALAEQYRQSLSISDVPDPDTLTAVIDEE